MAQTTNDIATRFRLKPTRAAKVSEISEATSASAVAPEDRVNFHIGNPVQDARLSSALLRATLGIDVQDTSLTDDDPQRLLDALDAGGGDRPLLDLLTALIRKSAPYLPRGGFTRTSPSPLVLAFDHWLHHQQEPLRYDLGKSSGHREIVLASGGVREALRVLFHALSVYLAELPARVLLHQLDIPPHLVAFSGLHIQGLPANEQAALDALRAIVDDGPDRPTFVVLGAVPSEETRRSLRSLSLTRPLFFLEVNDAPNHLSLAREAKLVNRVIRILSPGIFSPDLRHLSLLFLAGNAEYLSLFETLHFQLKGTPSASETELVHFLIQPGTPENRPAPAALPVEPPREPTRRHGQADATLEQYSFQTERRLGTILSARQVTLDAAAIRFAARAEHGVERIESSPMLAPVDRFASQRSLEVIREVTASPWDEHLIRDLTQSFLRSFAAHHAEYDPAACAVVSGSARTALSLLGFHCGIHEVIFPDLSWTYEHCFPRVHVVPLTPDFQLDSDAILRCVDERVDTNPAWKDSGAVVLNNPHNATGRIFNPAAVTSLLESLLTRGIMVVDDLSYQNVVPADTLPDIPTLRQMAQELVRTGRIPSSRADLVVTVHSLSKTDCLAGARLSVIEIRMEELRMRFNALNATIIPNAGAILVGYLLYRNPPHVVRAYWRLRNSIFAERMNAIATAFRSVPADRNPFALDILPPTGSMYPILQIHKLPSGLSLEWVAAGLARQGIGMIPLSTFARTEEGFETGRKAFRLTLGGTDGAEALSSKTRRVLIDLNRLIGEEASRYSRKSFSVRGNQGPGSRKDTRWAAVEEALHNALPPLLKEPRFPLRLPGQREQMLRAFSHDFLEARLDVFRQRYLDRQEIARDLMERCRSDNGSMLGDILERELFRDSLSRRKEAFQQRMFDRTVHPTQMFSLQTEMAFDTIEQELLSDSSPSLLSIERAAQALVAEFAGTSVAISSTQEADEICLDLDSLVAAEQYAGLHQAGLSPLMLSFWGDWDGSTRPSGQGHRLIASVLLSNVNRLSRLLQTLAMHDIGAGVDGRLLAEIERLPRTTGRFVRLLNEITALTHQLEKRYRGILPFHAKSGRLRQIGMTLHLARDPVTSLWYHNDRLEHRMLELRRRRKEGLEYYFALNKRLRKEVFRLIPAVTRGTTNPVLLRQAVLYRDLLQRVVISPRIHQNMVTAQDPFAIDTTVFNILEINEIAARYGNPGIVLALQISMSTQPEALIDLDRRMRARREHILRDSPDLEIPSVWLTPLFEDRQAVGSVLTYVNKLWEYSLQSRRLNQETHERFAELTTEVFIAGSDLSQQVSQAAGMQLYRQAKHDILQWTAGHGLTGRVRLKMGCGEPMQRQGGYYGTFSGLPAFLARGDGATSHLSRRLHASARRSALYATTPMMGVFAGGDLRTIQSALAEKMRHLPVRDLAQLFHHLKVSQDVHSREIVRAGEELAESRLITTTRGKQALERLTLGTADPVLHDFLGLLTQNFRQILYGRDEDVVGIHILSYFIARTTPALRDRPTVRPVSAGKDRGNRILERIASTIPLSRYGSLLRAIAHNQAQTTVLGIPQLSTGLFRALDSFTRHESVEGDPETFVADRILPHLPVYEILQNLRLYLDVERTCLRSVERAFPAGNAALLALREDVDAMGRFIPLLQQELVRRHGVDVGDFFEGSRFIPDLLPALRPDLAVLLQQDLFNTDPAKLTDLAHGPIDPSWKKEISRLMRLPLEVRQWREHAWSLLEQPVFERVDAFVELAVALYAISGKDMSPELASQGRRPRLPSGLESFFRMSGTDDEMHRFLGAAIEYLAIASEGLVEVPANVIRAMKEVERIARIEDQALSTDDQNRLRFFLLQIARLTGENG